MSKAKTFIKTFFSRLGLGIYKSGPDYFGTYHNRPKKAVDVVVQKPDNSRGAQVAIVLQGGLRYEDDFTLETVKLYQKLYPAATLILSTWDTEDKNVLSDIEKLGVTVIVNHFPDELKGHGSNNLQLISSRSGIEYAKKHGAEFILKTRTDQRMYGEGNLSYFINLLRCFPLNVKTTANQRLVVCSSGCFKNRLYNVSDMLIFGHSEDVLKYFSCPEDTREHKDILEKDDSIGYSKKRPGEIYFSTHYIESLGFELKWTKEDSDYYFKELFVVADCATLDWCWPKYSDKEYRWQAYNNPKLLPLTHRDWLNMQDS